MSSEQPFQACKTIQEDIMAEGGKCFAQALKWHVMPVGGQVATQMASRLQMPSHTEAVIVLIDFSDVTTSLEVIAKVRAQARQEASAPQVIAILFGLPADATIKVVIETQRALLLNGVDDVITEPVDVAGARFAVAITLERLRQKKVCIRKLMERQHNKEAKTDKFFKSESSSHSSGGAGVEKHAVYWENISGSLNGLAPLNIEISKSVRTNTQVGPCVLEAVLGSGGYGKVYAAEHLETKAREAIKVLNKTNLCSQRCIQQIKREIEALRRLDHEHIVKLYGVLQGPCHLFIRMELGGDASLHQVIKASEALLTPDSAMVIQGQLLKAIAYCHSQHIAHNDMKPENVAMDVNRWHCKLLDFGFCSPADRPSQYRVHTMPFIAPEMLLADGGKCCNLAGCDVWACGGVLLEMLGGLFALNRAMHWELDVGAEPTRGHELTHFLSDLSKLKRGVVEHQGGELPAGIWSCLESLLAVDPERRVSAAEREALVGVEVAVASAAAATAASSYAAAAAGAGASADVSIACSSSWHAGVQGHHSRCEQCWAVWSLVAEPLGGICPRCKIVPIGTASQECRETFDRFDINKNGVISMDEMRQVAQPIAPPPAASWEPPPPPPPAAAGEEASFMLRKSRLEEVSPRATIEHASNYTTATCGGNGTFPLGPPRSPSGSRDQAASSSYEDANRVVLTAFLPVKPEEPQPVRQPRRGGRVLTRRDIVVEPYISQEEASSSGLATSGEGATNVGSDLR